MDAIQRDDPIPVRRVCATPEAMFEALGSLTDWGDAVILERDGAPAGALISIKDLELFQHLLFDAELQGDIADAATIADPESAVPLQSILDQYGVTLAH